MGMFLSQILLPLLLLGAASLNWSLISLGDLVASILLQLKAPKTGLYCRKRSLIFWCVVIFSALAVLSNAIFQIILAVEGSQWKMIDTHWEKLFGLTRDRELLSPSITHLLVVQPLIALVALSEIYSNGSRSDRSRESCLARFASGFNAIDLNLKGLCCLLLPAVELAVGISHPSWASLPFFIRSCIGLVNWSLTSNILSFFWGWKYLLSYAGFNIVVLYVYQLPVDFYFVFQWFADFIGLFKINTKSTWSETCSGVSLIIFHFMLSFIRPYLLEKEIVSATEDSLTEQLLPSKDSLDMKHSSLLWRGSFSWTISVNFFTFGLPISLLVISFWTFHFASICALGLLAYAGYILHTFPSLFRLHQLNRVLLAFILFWAASTYIFNVAFILLDNELQKDMDLWESIGLWHYHVPGVYIFAQICLATFVATGNLANRSILQYLSAEDSPSTYDHGSEEESEESGTLIIATVAWALRKTSRALLLWLILSIALTPGYIPSLYSKFKILIYYSPQEMVNDYVSPQIIPVEDEDDIDQISLALRNQLILYILETQLTLAIFFLIYLLSHTISRRMHQSLIYLCEIHFVLKYVLQLKLLYKVFEREGSLAFQILSDFGLHDHSSFADFAKIGGLACICAAYKNGPDVILTFSTILQQVPFSPSGWSLLKAGLNKSVLIAVYKAKSSDSQFSNSPQVRSIASYLSALDHKLLSAYRSCGTYTVAATILVMVYLMTPNYASFGYLFFLLQWMVGRQLLEKTRTRLWFPLKVYSVFIFLLLYGSSAFISFRKWLSITIDLYPAFGFNLKASIFSNIWKSLIILIVMQLYSYERKENQISVSPLKNISVFRRFLMWHCEKILFLALLYASLSPISAFGFLYLLGLVICSTLPKSSRLPSKFFISYSAFLLMADYLFQIWGGIVEMFPGQKNFYISRFIGLSLFSPGFLGLESGLRGKVLVIITCLLQYNVFRWIEKTRNYKKRGKWEEPCALFGHEIEETDEFFLSTESSSRWGGSEGNYNWSKKLNQIMKREKLEMQKTTLKIYIKYWMDNIFNVAGLEINMITLLLASFAVLNAISLLYVSLLAACVLLPRLTLKKLWPIFVLLFASVVTIEYMALWLNLTSWEERSQKKATINCHDCWRSSEFFPIYCKKCWLGIVVDDSRVVISYYLVLMVSCFKLRADYLSSVSKSHNYWKMRYQWKKASLLGDLSFETKNMWTVLDYLRHYSYCHLLNLVLALILITGTLEYDILHLGYLGFAMVFFRLRLQILKKKNAIFKYLQMYNFGLIVLSLAYQSPFIGDVTEGKCDTIDYIYEVIGFHKYDYGFQITSRSALVEIIIFSLVSLQSYMFSSAEFDYVSKYLEAELIDSLVHEKEKKAAWKTAQLQHIRQSEEKKRLQNLQVENMKSEVLSLQIQLHSMTNKAMFGNFSPEGQSCRRRENCSLSSVKGSSSSDKEESNTKKTEFPSMVRSSSPVAVNTMINSIDSFYGVSDFDVSREEISSSYIRGEVDIGPKRKMLSSTIRLFGDGISQVRSLGRFAVNNLAKILDIEKEEVGSDDDSSDDGEYYEVEDQNVATEPLGQTSSVHSGFERTVSDIPRLKTGTIFRYMWAKMRLNNDIVCYCCFVLIFLWNFSLLSMVYLAALFLYALCVNGGPSNMFWVIMLMYTEFCILIQYIYQIVTQHCGVKIQLDFLEEVGFPVDKIVSSFVVSNFPLFLVYLFVLLQSSIAVSDGEWVSNTDFNLQKQRNINQDGNRRDLTYGEKSGKLLLQGKELMILTFRTFYRYWESVTEGAETPPYFVQLSMEVNLQPDDGIQPEKIESGINKLLKIVHTMRCDDNKVNSFHPANQILVQSIERSSENPNVVLAVLEVVHVKEKPFANSSSLETSLTPAADVANEILTAQRCGVSKEVGFPYPIISVIGGGKREIDLYAYVFCADFVVFSLVAMFYHSVIKNNSEFLEVYQLEDQFPIEFVFLLMILFFLIVLDRVIYLSSITTGKVMFYLFTLTLFTYSTTQFAWHMEPSHNHGRKLALRAIFLTKAISLALQATQIRYGISDKSNLYRKFLTKRVSHFNYFCFRLYRALPFLYELRCILDWSCTTTSLTMYDWLKLEDIHASLFLVKCDVDLNRAKRQQGQRQTKMTKFCSGICLFFVLLCVIWAPMLMYSSGNPTNIANPIKDASVRIDLKTNDGRLTLFETTICEKFAWDELDKSVDLDPQGYLTEYNEKDVQLICCQADASTLWLVPPVVQARFIQSLNSSMNIIFYWQFIRDRPKSKEIVKYELVVPNHDLPKAMDVMAVLNGTSERFSIHNVYPRYFRVTGSGDVRFLEKAVHLVSGHLVLNRGIPQWWSFHDMNASDVKGCRELAGPMATIVSEETPQGILGETLSKFSIWGLYITFVFAVGRFIRIQCSDLRMRIPFENLPSCDRLLAICENIYIARAEGELEVEEVLYWILVKIYRSPHILLEYTKVE